MPHNSWYHMHLTSSLIVTGVVIYASQGVVSGESGPLPENFSGSSLDVMLHCCFVQFAYHM